MHSHRKTRSFSTALALTGGLVALAGLPAVAAAKVLPKEVEAQPRAGQLKYGSATLTLASGASSRLKSAGGKLTGSGTVDVKGSKITADMVETGGAFDPTTMSGTFLIDGGLTAKGRSKSAKITKITIEPGVEKRVIAKVGGKQVELGSVKGGKATFSRQADGTLKGAKIALSSGGAKKLNAATGGGFGAGAFATLAIEATAAELPLKDGVATMTIDPALYKILGDNGFGVTAEAPATAAGPVVKIPLVGGAFDPVELTGRLSLEGKVTIGNATQSLNLFGFRTAIGAGQSDLYANLNEGLAAIVANVDTTNLSLTLNGNLYIGRGAVLKLSKEALSVLKGQFKIDLPAGTVMGTVDLDGTLSGK